MAYITASEFSDQLNRLADAAAVSNPLDNPPLIGGTAWAASTAYVTGNIVGNGTYAYICKTSGTSAGSGGPTGTGVSITDGSVVWDFYALQTAPVIEAFTTSTSLSSPVTTSYFGSPTSFRLLGGNPTNFFGNVVGTAVSVGLNNNGNAQNGTPTVSGLSGYGFSIEFYTDSPKFEIITNSASVYRLIVNNQYASLSQITVGTGGGPQYNVIDFTNSGGRETRHYIIEIGAENNNQSVSAFFGINTLVTDTPPWAGDKADSIRAVFLGDSITVGWYSNIPRIGYADIACKLLGWKDCWLSGMGGRGYIAVTAPGFPTIPQAVIPPYYDVTSFNPDVIVIAGGVNDVDIASPSVIQAAVVNTIKPIRFLCPNTLIIVLGPWHRLSDPALAPAEVAIKAGLASADPLYGTRSFFIPNITQNWMFGTGTDSVQTGDGNLVLPNLFNLV